MTSNTPASLRDILVGEAIAMLDAGEHDPSLRSVARAAGVSAMAPYRHFADKAALLRAAAAAGFVLLTDVLRAADAAALPEGDRAALVAQGVAYVAFAQARPALFRLMFTGAPDPACGPAAPVDGDAYAVLARRVAALGPQAPEVATVAAWSIVHGLAMLVLDGRLPPDPGTVRVVVTQFADGLRPA